MRIKIKLISLVSALVIIISFLIVGVYAASSQNINLRGTINF